MQNPIKKKIGQTSSLRAKALRLALIIVLSFGFALTHTTIADQPNSESTKPDVSIRFADATSEVPDFQRHVSPLLGRLGCNGRACHGSFQGKGDFRLSLFGYDFAADHSELMAEGSSRIDLKNVDESLIIAKPTDADNHEGGLRYKKGSWQYRVLHNWIAGGAKSIETPQKLASLEVIPSEIVFRSATDKAELRVVAHWADGSHEDVTSLSRFQTKSPEIAEVDERGQIRSGIPGDTHLIVQYDIAVVPVLVVRPFVTERPSTSTVENKNGWTHLDGLVQTKLDKMGINRSEPADDLTFLRRVCLDIAGTLPSPDEIRLFLADSAPDKRTRKINELLETPAYAAYWTTFFCDMTGNNSQELRELSLNSDLASQQWYDWIFERVNKNVGYDDLVEGIVLSQSRLPDEGYGDYCVRMSRMLQSQNTDDFVSMTSMPSYWMRRETQDPPARAISFAHAFMGVQIQCAQCHKHPFDQWTKDDFEQFSRFFSGVEYARARPNTPKDREEFQAIMTGLGIPPGTRAGNVNKIIAESVRSGKTVPFPQLNVTKPKVFKDQEKKKQEAKDKRKRGPMYYTNAKLLGDEAISLKEIDDVREPVMNWLRDPNNPYFATALVNRVWAMYFGVGIVNPIDDLSLANPPSNAPLLDYLSRGFVEHDYDLKWLHREIVNSRTYQTSWQPNETNANDRQNFSRALPRRLPAEVIVDISLQASSNDDANQDFAKTLDDRAIAIAGTALGRANNRGRGAGFALEAFGRSTRDNNCDCDRSAETSLIQTVYMQNDKDIHFLLSKRDSWLGEMRAHESTVASDSKTPSVEDLRQRIERLTRLKTNLEANGNSQQSEQIANRIAGFESTLKKLEQPEATVVSEPVSDALHGEKLVVEAYLRTVGRFPSDTEMARCQSHIAEDTDFVTGLTGIVWALMNTKEFIVNH